MGPARVAKGLAPRLPDGLLGRSLPTGRGALPEHSAWDTGAHDLQVKWDVMKRKEVPKKVKPMPRAPLVLI